MALLVGEGWILRAWQVGAVSYIAPMERIDCGKRLATGIALNRENASVLGFCVVAGEADIGISRNRWHCEPKLFRTAI